MTAVRNWLEAIGLPQYGEAFETNEIDTDLLAQVDQTLKDIGISIAGHRLRIRSATTRRLTGGLFEYRDLGTVVLKGLGAKPRSSRSENRSPVATLARTPWRSIP